MSIVEELRWARPADEPAEKQRLADLRAARRRLDTAAMLARVPRRLADMYDRLVAAAHKSGMEDRGEGGGGRVDMLVEECLELATETLCLLLWRPMWGRLTYRWHLANLNALIERNKVVRGGENLRWKYHQP